MLSSAHEDLQPSPTSIGGEPHDWAAGPSIFATPLLGVQGPKDYFVNDIK